MSALDNDIQLARLAVALCYREDGTRAAIMCGAWDNGTNIDVALHGVRLGMAYAATKTTEPERNP